MRQLVREFKNLHPIYCHESERNQLKLLKRIKSINFFILSLTLTVYRLRYHSRTHRYKIISHHIADTGSTLPIYKNKCKPSSLTHRPASMHIKYILPILLLILFNIFYQKSLSGCPFDPPDLQTCIKWFSATVVTLVKHCLYSVTAATTLTILVLYRLTHPCWLIPFTLNLLYFYVAYDGRSFDHHGFFNFWIFLALFILFLVLLAIGK